jgi:hypothetical protein
LPGASPQSRPRRNPVLAAQDAADRPAPSLAPRIEQARAELDALDAAVRDANEKLLSTALAADREADRLLAEARSLRDTQPARLAELARLERTLSEDPSEAFRRWRAQLPARVAHDELARRLARSATHGGAIGDRAQRRDCRVGRRGWRVLPP